MTALGFTEGLVRSIGFDVTTAGTVLQNFNIKMKNTTQTAIDHCLRTEYGRGIYRGYFYP